MARTTRSEKASAGKKSDGGQNETKELENPKRSSIPKVATTKSGSKRKTLPGPPAMRKYQSSSIFSPKFGDLPAKFLTRMAAYLDPVSRFRAQKSCKLLRTAIQSSAHRFKVFGFQVRHFLNMELNGRLVYYEREDPDSKDTGCILKYGKNQKTLPDASHVEMAIADVARILENPGFSTDKMRVVLYERDEQIFSRCAGLLPNASRTRDSKFDVAHLEMYAYRMSEMVESLTTMQPGTLKTIELSCMDWAIEPNSKIENMSEIYASEQFQRAKRVHISGGLIGWQDVEKHFQRFEHFDVELDRMRPEDVVRLRDLLTTSAPSFQSCRLTAWNKVNPLAVCDALGARYDALQAKLEAASSSAKEKKTKKKSAQQLKELEVVEHTWRVPSDRKKTKDVYLFEIRVEISNRKRGSDGELVWKPRKVAVEIRKKKM